jgi:SPP1 gp7 family putative phage head morphogenesis protein
MSCCTNQAALAQDPTQTQTLRRELVGKMNKRFRRVRGLIRETVVENDALHIGADARLADPRDAFRRLPDERLADEFQAWLRDVLRAEVLEPLPLPRVRRGEHWLSKYIKLAYQSGARLAGRRLNAEGVSVEDQDVAAFIQLPVSQQQLKRVYSRAYSNLKNITDDAATEIREELTEGLAAGDNPREMASRLNERVETLTNTRATVLARTEILESHNEAAISRYERAGVDSVSVSGEVLTAQDSRVCPLCEHIAGETFSMDEMRSETFTYEAGEDEPSSLSGEYRIQPPIHPQCRCSVIPIVN